MGDSLRAHRHRGCGRMPRSFSVRDRTNATPLSRRSIYRSPMRIHPRSVPLAACLLSMPAAAELLFVPNEGQTQPAVRFMAKTPRLTAYFMQTEILFALKGARVGFHLLGANRTAQLAGGKQRTAKANFFFGNRPEQWR